MRKSIDITNMERIVKNIERARTEISRAQKRIDAVCESYSHLADFYNRAADAAWENVNPEETYAKYYKKAGKVESKIYYLEDLKEPLNQLLKKLERLLKTLQKIEEGDYEE